MEEILKKFVFDLYGIEITKDTPIAEIVEDSLSKIDFLFEIENHIKCSIPPDEVLEVETFGDLLGILNERCS